MLTLFYIEYSVSWQINIFSNRYYSSLTWKREENFQNHSRLFCFQYTWFCEMYNIPPLIGPDSVWHMKVDRLPCRVVPRRGKPVTFLHFLFPFYSCCYCNIGFGSAFLLLFSFQQNLSSFWLYFLKYVFIFSKNAFPSKQLWPERQTFSLLTFSCHRPNRCM